MLYGVFVGYVLAPNQRTCDICLNTATSAVWRTVRLYLSLSDVDEQFHVVLHLCCTLEVPWLCVFICTSEILCLCNFILTVLALDLEGVHDVKLHHPSSSVATSNQ